MHGLFGLGEEVNTILSQGITFIVAEFAPRDLCLMPVLSTSTGTSVAYTVCGEVERRGVEIGIVYVEAASLTFIL